jgi:hypothetical protein
MSEAGINRWVALQWFDAGKPRTTAGNLTNRRPAGIGHKEEHKGGIRS